MDFYKIIPEKQEYKGARFFAYDWNSDKVVQVCVWPGEEKRGKSNSIGISLITKTSFVSNYFTHYTRRCSKSEYEKELNKLIKIFQNIK